ADSLATGPAAWSAWKADLVRELVVGTDHVLGGGRDPQATEPFRRAAPARPPPARAPGGPRGPHGAGGVPGRVEPRPGVLVAVGDRGRRAGPRRPARPAGPAGRAGPAPRAGA